MPLACARRLAIVFCSSLWFASPAASAEPAPAPPRLELPAVPYNYIDLPLPKHFEHHAAKVFDMTPADNPTTNAGAALGRALFYDTRLSANDTISCGSCHFQKHAFSDPRRLSPGFEGIAGDRNSMSLVNLRFMRNGAFWDERGGSLEQQALLPIESPVEMGAKLPDVVAMLQADDNYRRLFRDAFGDDAIDSERLAKALSQFVRSLVSCQSKYDAGAAQVETMEEDFPNFTAAENHGKSLFVARCAICHRPARGAQMAHFDLFRSLNNGVDADAAVSDTGVGDAMFDIRQVGLFKPSSLRNIEHSAPYMHDGRFATLEEVIEHYSSGVQRNPAVSGVVFRMQFSDAEKQALIAFLKTLSDEQFLTDPKFSDPWVRDGASPNAIVVAPPAALKPVAPTSLTSKQQNDLLAAGRGLPMEETLSWLRSLDIDRDGKLAPLEYREVVNILIATDATLRGPERSPSEETPPRERPAVAAAYPPEIVALADFDGDGRLNPQEIRRYEAFKRFVELRDGGRLESRLDGLFNSFNTLLTPEKFLVARQQLRETKHDLHRQTLQLDAALIRKLRALLTAEEFIGLQLASLNDWGAVSGRGETRDVSEETIDRIVRQHFERFDANQNGQLDDEELHEAARALNQLPGGFGQRRGVGAELPQFTRRVLSFGAQSDCVWLSDLPDRLVMLMAPADQDDDGLLTTAEINTFVREEGFKRLSEHGVYVGGGFEGIFTRVKVDQLDLPDSQRAALATLLDDYAAQLAALYAATVARSYAELRKQCGPAQPVNPQAAARPVR